MPRITLLLLGAFSLGFAPAPFLTPWPGAAGGGLKALQGEWSLLAYHDHGARREVPGDATYLFAGHELTMRQYGNVISRWKVTIETSDPAGSLTRVGAEPAHVVGLVFRCAYRREGDDLLIRYTRDGVTRPKGHGPEAGVIIDVLKRKKP